MAAARQGKRGGRARSKQGATCYLYVRLVRQVSRLCSGQACSAATAAARRSVSTGGGGLSAANAAGRPSASTGGGGLSAATAAAHRSASSGGGGLSAATAAARRSASMGDCDVSAATAAILCQIQGCPRQDLPFSGASSLLQHMRTMHGDNPRAVTKRRRCTRHTATRRSLSSTSTTCPSAAAGCRRRVVRNIGL